MPEVSIRINDRQFSSFHQAISNLIDEALALHPDTTTYEQKYEVFCFLYSAGIMSFRGAVYAICEHLGVTRPCVYKWMKLAEGMA
jgi:predicted transcriptional regulator YheO